MKKYFIFGVIVILVASLLSACAPTAANSFNPYPRQLNASGQGKVYIVPDLAYIYVGVHVQTASLSDSLNQSNTKAADIASQLKELGVADQDIQTSAFNVYPQQNYDPNGQPTEIQYVVENTVNVTLRDLSKLGQVLDAVVRSGANSINGISFDVADRTTIEAQARELAIKDAQSRAGEVAKVSGVELGKLISVSVYNSSSPVTVYEGKGGAAMSAASGQVPVAAGQLLITADASVAYEIK
ncbi:uncharacterized conserved protein [Longilinea arvoryzae]|uniref:Uncharacterized conserved protein n=1 Tax=Longilinea arvoryzae TaxID=360412 RepID=A0A0S7BJV1_9CHLR|nr:SIMPL domain-containing protein [Longilinea arvoryzae]GAP15428.1 uncharacterized conserved protein [Longilinea arvoryzae]